MDYPVGFDSSIHARKPICGVLATAIVAGVSYPVAYAAIRRALFTLYPSRKRFGGRVSLKMIEYALDGLAVRYAKTKILSGTRLHILVPTLKRDTTYLIRVPGHIMTVRNNAVLDQQKHLNFLLFKNRKVTHVYEITGKGW